MTISSFSLLWPIEASSSTTWVRHSFTGEELHAFGWEPSSAHGDSPKTEDFLDGSTGTTMGEPRGLR
jgi:hypothetical protein